MKIGEKNTKLLCNPLPDSGTAGRSHRPLPAAQHGQATCSWSWLRRGPPPPALEEGRAAPQEPPRAGVTSDEGPEQAQESRMPAPQGHRQQRWKAEGSRGQTPGERGLAWRWPCPRPAGAHSGCCLPRSLATCPVPGAQLGPAWATEARSLGRPRTSSAGALDAGVTQTHAVKPGVPGGGPFSPGLAHQPPHQRCFPGGASRDAVWGRRGRGQAGAPHTPTSSESTWHRHQE